MYSPIFSATFLGLCLTVAKARPHDDSSLYARQEPPASTTTITPTAPITPEAPATPTAPITTPSGPVPPAIPGASSTTTTPLVSTPTPGVPAPYHSDGWQSGEFQLGVQANQVLVTTSYLDPITLFSVLGPAMITLRGTGVNTSAYVTGAVFPDLTNATITQAIMSRAVDEALCNGPITGVDFAVAEISADPALAVGRDPVSLRQRMQLAFETAGAPDLIAAGAWDYFVYLALNNPDLVTLTTAPGIGPLVLTDTGKQLGATSSTPNGLNQP